MLFTVSTPTENTTENTTGGQDPAWRKSLLFINAGESNQLGLYGRMIPLPANEHVNNFLRYDWSTVDRFRGVQGAYIAPSPGNLQLWSTEASLVNLVNYSDWPPAAPLNIVADQSVWGHSPSSGQPQEMVDYFLVPNNAAWNAANNEGPPDLLQHTIQNPDIDEGDPYYSYFLEDGISVNGVQPYPGVFDRQGPEGAFVDHTFAYLKPSENIDQRTRGGLEINIEPVYNFYLDTMPAWEQITSNVPEPVLPNFYIFETELRNTGSQTYSPDYYKALTMFSEDVALWFVEHPEGGYTETTSKSYYQAYVQSLQTIKNTESRYNLLKTQYNTQLKNVAVLHSDIDAIYQTNRPDLAGSALSFLPFYNIVTVGSDTYRSTIAGTTDLPGQAESFFGSLFGVAHFERDAESFIDILQMYIITFLEKAATSSPAQFHVFDRSPLEPSRTLLTSSLLFDLSRRDAGAGSLPGVPTNYDGFEQYALFLEDRITNNDSNLDISTLQMLGQSAPWEQDNVVLIRDYSNAPGWESRANRTRVYNPPDATSVGRFYDKVESGDITLPRRAFSDILMNQGARSETILYKIDKRVIDSAGNILPDVVQTIYLSPKFIDSGPLQYIDSQVRYGVRYQYDIKQVRVVFGNQYYYDNLLVHTVDSESTGYGRAVGNALGIYRAEEPGILADNYVDQLFPYLKAGWDTEMSVQQIGHFIVDPTNKGEISEAQWEVLASGVGTPGFMSLSVLDRVGLVFKKGWGFDGNPDGGAISDHLNLQGITAPSEEEVFDETSQQPPTQEQIDAALAAGRTFYGNPFLGNNYHADITDLRTREQYLSSDPATAQAELNQLRSGILSLIRDILGPDEAIATGLWFLSSGYIDEGYSDLHSVLAYMILEMLRNIRCVVAGQCSAGGHPHQRYTQPIAVFTAHMLVHYLNVPGVEEVWNY